MNIALGCDHGGFGLKQEILSYLQQAGYAVNDLGCHSEESVDYPDFAERVCAAIGSRKADRGILICGTGIGMSMAANKIPNIRAAACSEPYSAILSKRHNNSNVLCMGARVVASGLATLITEGWLNASYEGERHQRRVDMLTRIEQRYSIPAVPHVTKEDDTNPIHPAETPTSE